MKLKSFYALFLALILTAPAAYASVVIQEDGEQEGIVEKLNISTNLNVSVSGNTATIVKAPDAAAVALTAGAAVALTVVPGTDQYYTDTITTDNQDQTITFSGTGTVGDEITIKFITDAAGAGDEVITFHSTLVKSTGTLTLANVASDHYLIRFISDGTLWNEISRTAVQAA